MKSARDGRSQGRQRLVQASIELAVLAVSTAAELFKHEIRFKNLLVNHALVSLVLLPALLLRLLADRTIDSKHM